MTAGIHVTHPHPVPKKQMRPKDIPNLSAELRDLETDIVEHPFPESTRPRQALRFHEPLPRSLPTLKDKRRHTRQSQSQKKKAVPPTDPDMLSQTKPDAPLTPQAVPPTDPNVPSLTEPDAPLTPQTQPEVIDLTGDD
ncbi:hypothetical protein EI94DRAFT_1701347 [Lactarius quietus]|nr:hypothetical protein EI94DRAFT_1701347 [Lactarius quietus]